MLLLGIAIIAVMAAVSLRRGYMDVGGVIAAAAVGTIVLLGGFHMLVAMVAFFVSSSILTRLRYEAKAAAGVAEKPSGRSYRQVLGAGGVAAAISALIALRRANLLAHNSACGVLAVAFLGALSTSTADTWAVEVGVLSESQPRLIVAPWRRVPRGASGGITLLGEAASALGASFMGLIAYLLATSGGLGVEPLKCLVAVTVAGFVGEKVDSVLGATLQARYYCPRCRVITDARVHKCGRATVLKGGLPWFTNEAVNVVSTAVGALLAALLYAAMAQGI
ncbi:MAG: DUF92 domain-containing protein [Thermoprotei archaeon]|nr:MAG: DUF92 domain-containing protein [Thermoprotei archaeon]